jgi:cytochrome c-type biogenesis protein CcmH
MKLGLIFAVMLVLAVGLVLLPLLKDAAKQGSKKKNVRIFSSLGALIILVSGGTYFLVGSPEVAIDPAFLEGIDQSHPDIGAMPVDGAMLPSVEDMMDGIRARLEENPENLDDWTSLSRSLLMMGRYGEAADAYRQTLLLAPDIAELHSAYGEALVLMNDGFISFDAAQAFENALLLDPEEVISKFYLGDYAFQEGDIEGAYSRWLALYEEVPVDTPWLPLLDQRIREGASKLGLDPPQILAEKQFQETEVMAEELQQMSSEDQMAMIEDMVATLAARLEDNPGDLEGWEHLGRSYMVVGRYEEGIRAYGMVAGARPDDPLALENYVQAILTWLEQSGQHISDQALAALQRLITLDPGNPTALFFLGQAAAERDDPASARLYWQRLLTMIEPGSETSEMVKQKLEGLD